MVKNEPGSGRTTFRRLKGTKVYGANGEPFGHVTDLEMNRSTLNPTHLIVHKGFFGGTVRVNLKYVESITSQAIRLWISPVEELVGAKVKDSAGKDMGVVREAEMNAEGNLEYVRVEARVITRTEHRECTDSYIIPVMPYDDMSLSIPPGVLDDGTIISPVEVKVLDMMVDAKEIVSLHKDVIVLGKRKEDYLIDPPRNSR